MGERHRPRHWILGGALTDAGEFHLVFTEAEHVQFHDTWYASGLRATASGDFEMTDVFVPAGYSVQPLRSRPQVDSPLAHFPNFTLLAVAVSSAMLGIARCAVDEAVALAQGKRQSYSSKLLAESPTAQIELSRAEATLSAARAFLMDELSSAWASASSGARVSAEARARIRLAGVHVAESAVKATDMAYTMAGGPAVFETSPLQRCLRVIHRRASTCRCRPPARDARRGAAGHPSTTWVADTPAARRPGTVGVMPEPRRTSARSLTTTTAVAREFAHHGSGYVLAGVVTGVLAARRRMGRVRVQDAVAVGLVVAAQPFFEWPCTASSCTVRPASSTAARSTSAAPPRPPRDARRRGRCPARHDLRRHRLGGRGCAGGRRGRADHAARGARAVAGHRHRCGGRRDRPGPLRVAHLLHHSGRKPFTARGRRLRAHHMAHHHRDERAWFGVTSDLGDRVFGTLPRRARLTEPSPVSRRAG